MSDTSAPNMMAKPAEHEATRSTSTGLSRSVNLVALALLAAVLVAIWAPLPAQAQKAKASVNELAGQTAALGKRVQQLEEQLLDIQVMIGTLQSMTKSRRGGRANSSFGGAGGNSAHVRGLETQIQALTAQVQQLSDRVAGGVGRRGDASAYQPAQPYATQSNAGLRPSSAPFALPSGPGADVGGFGTTTVTAGNDGIGGYLGKSQPAPGQLATAARSGQRASSADSKLMYERAYGYLLQQNFGGARTAFSQFLNSYPSDPLAGNAQYWLGETYYVRQKYRSAANAFLKGYQSYGSGNKAPDSLLKLAMSLDRLGQKDAACSSFEELRQKFPGAPAHVTKRARSERQRLGC